MAKYCGAKTRAGGKCKAPAMKNGRCRVHGGATPVTNQNAAKPGSIYSKFLTSKERVLEAQIVLGSLDDELRLTRLRLRRALAREQTHGNTAELYETVEREGGGEFSPSDETKKKVRDYVGIIDRLTARIESLERRRLELQLLQKQIDENKPDPSEPAAFEVLPYEDEG